MNLCKECYYWIAIGKNVGKCCYNPPKVVFINPNDGSPICERPIISGNTRACGKFKKTTTRSETCEKCKHWEVLLADVGVCKVKPPDVFFVNVIRGKKNQICSSYPTVNRNSFCSKFEIDIIPLVK